MGVKPTLYFKFKKVSFKQVTFRKLHFRFRICRGRIRIIKILAKATAIYYLEDRLVLVNKQVIKMAD